MVNRIPDLPDHVLGFTAHATVTADDYESVIIPAVEALFARQSKVRFLYHLGDDFDGFEAAARGTPGSRDPTPSGAAMPKPSSWRCWTIFWPRSRSTASASLRRPKSWRSTTL